MLAHCACFSQQIWRPLGDDDFNRAACGPVTLAGRDKITVKNDHVFVFTIESPDYQSSKSHYSIGKFANGQWEHLDFPFLFSNTNPTIDGTVANDETPFVLFNDEELNQPRVLKYEDNDWITLGSGISSEPSAFLNIRIGSDNLPQILYREGNFVKLKKFDGINWTLISETTDFIPYTSISLELDNNNVPYVVSNYQVGTTYNCFVRKFNGLQWEEVGITGFNERGSSLIFDSSNTPYMCVANSIKKLNGSTWENIAAPAITSYPLSMSQLLTIKFNIYNELYVGYIATAYPSSTQSFNIKKLSNGSWNSILSNGFMYDKIFTVAADNVYRVYFGPDFYPEVFQIGGVQTQLLGTSTFTSGVSSTSSSSPINELQTHDFAICNGVPLLASIDGKVSVRMFVDNDWTNLGAPAFSESDVRKVVIKSGTDGEIYVAYNNEISSTYSDTKLTVKKLTLAGWQAVGPVNFSQSAGAQFDFKLGHANEPYVLYMSGRVQKFDGSNWVFVGSSAFTGDSPARLALDNNDIPYIAFQDGSNNNHIAVKKWNGNVWEYVDQPGLAAYTGIQYRPRIVFDSSNKLYLAFADNNFNVHVKELNAGVWESVGTDFFTTQKTDQFELSIDHDNVLHIVYNELDDNFRTNVKVKKFNGSDWEFVGSPNLAPASVIQAKIDFWADNTPFVSYSVFNGTKSEIHTRYFGESDVLSAIESDPMIKKSEWTLTPNPVTNSFTLNGHGDIKKLEIYDLLGKKVGFHYETTKNVDISSLQSGMYILKATTNETTIILKFIKKQ